MSRGAALLAVDQGVHDPAILVDQYGHKSVESMKYIQDLIHSGWCYGCPNTKQATLRRSDGTDEILKLKVFKLRPAAAPRASGECSTPAATWCCS